MNEKIYAVDPSAPNNGIWIDLESDMDAHEIEEAAMTRLGCKKVGYSGVRNVPKCLIEWGSLSDLIWDYLSLDEDKKWIAMRLEQKGEDHISYLEKIIDDEYSEYDGWDEIFEEWLNANGNLEYPRWYVDTDTLKRDLMANGDYMELGFKIHPNWTHNSGHPEDVIVEFHY